MKPRFVFSVLAVLVLLISVTAYAQYKYNVGPNFVNMPGSSCRAATMNGEGRVTHANGATTVKTTVGTQRLFCPIQRRGTSFYGGFATPSGGMPQGSALRAKVNAANVQATDNSTTGKVQCFLFAARESDQALFFGGTQALCSNSIGCLPQNVASSWTGTNTLQVNPFPSDFTTLNTVNFGITCDVPPGSSIQYTETGVTPN